MKNDDAMRLNSISGKSCYIAGWGNKKLRTATEPRLLHVPVPLVSKEKCNEAKSYGGMITDNMVCAGFEEGGKDTCEGDSGGMYYFLSLSMISVIQPIKF